MFGGSAYMTIEELTQLVATGESDRLEFKKTTGELNGGMQTLCGMLNGRGGCVLFGVTEGGRIIGQDVADATLKEIANAIGRIDPAMTFLQERLHLPSGREVLVIVADSSPSAPHVFHGRPYQRIHSTTSLMPQAEYERKLLDRGHAVRRWETQPATGFTFDRLDASEVSRLLTDAVAAGRLEATVTTPAEALAKMHLMSNGVPTRSAVVAFAIDPLPDYPQCALRMARFRGTTKNEFLDQRQLTGHAFRLLEVAGLFLRRHLPVAGRFEPGLFERQDEPLFPFLALREALVNALCHRDYSIPGGAVSVAVFDDRLEIISTGILPSGLTVADLMKDHVSKPRNPNLAEVFYRRGLIERWGRGTQKIVDLCVRAGHPAPEFEERAGDLIVRFIPSGYVPPHRVEHDLTDRQRRVLHFLRDGQRRPISAI